MVTTSTLRVSSRSATYLQDHPAQHVLPSQSPMRLGGFPQRIACCDRHTNPALREVPIQPLELPRTRDHVEGPHAERATSCHNTSISTSLSGDLSDELADDGVPVDSGRTTQGMRLQQVRVDRQP
jgi:hypothetical protein